ncbi:MAG: beta-1,6-N-acetylglucosaminyltransferase [Janthinobacterium lividum]
MPRFAFIVLCHHKPKLLLRLVKKLRHEDCITVIHVDGKSDASVFRATMPPELTAFFVSDHERVAVHWCGFSMVDATLRSIRHALTVAPRIERFVLLSGVDHPLYPIGNILDRLSGSEEFIRVDRVLDPNGTEWFDRCANRVFLGDNRWLNPRECGRTVDRLTRRIEQRLTRLTSYEAPVFYGPSWWALTRSAIDHILHIERTHPEAIKWFRRTRSPDEMLFQTLMRASPFADRITQDATRAGGVNWPAGLAGVHYAEFLDGAASPKTLELKDLPALKASGALFGRKIDRSRSGALLEALATDS